MRKAEVRVQSLGVHSRPKRWAPASLEFFLDLLDARTHYEIQQPNLHGDQTRF